MARRARDACAVGGERFQLVGGANSRMGRLDLGVPAGPTAERRVPLTAIARPKPRLKEAEAEVGNRER